MPHVAGIGIDLVQVARIRRLLDGPDGSASLDRLFTARERDHARGKADPAPHLAARFAAKEAFVKALGCGLCPEVSWREIGVVADPAGRPALELAGATAQFFAAAGGGTLHLSLGHEDDHAVAMVILER